MAQQDLKKPANGFMYSEYLSLLTIPVQFEKKEKKNITAKRLRAHALKYISINCVAIILKYYFLILFIFYLYIYIINILLYIINILKYSKYI